MAKPFKGAHATHSVPVLERRRSVASKLSAPPLRPGIVERPLPLERLTSADGATVVLLSAPPGYGKTTLLSLWCERDERPFAWISLDPTDNDPVVLVAELCAALDPIIELDSAVGESLNTTGPPLEEVVLPALIDASSESGNPFVLVLDDLHLVTEKRSHTVIGYLAERLPRGSQLALGTRTDPPLSLGSLRAHGRLTELRATELSLGRDEARALLVAAGVPLADRLLVQLLERTEGWPAALYLASLSLRDRDDPEEFVERFAGTSRHVADFLSEDVFARQPERVSEFLLHTSVLEELTAPLCDAVYGSADAEEELRELERTNLFVVPLDEERFAYRYHHLFAEYLRAELTHRKPDIVPELHRRAWRWYRERGLTGRAIGHAHAAGDVEAAALLIAEAWPEVVESGQIRTAETWLSRLDDEQIEGHAPLAVAAAWINALAGDSMRAQRFAEAAHRGSWDGPMPDGAASLESALATMSCAFGSDGVSRMRTVAQRALDLEPHANRQRATALGVLGIAHVLAGDFESGRNVLSETVRIAGDRSIGALSRAQLAVISLRDGDEDTACAYIQQAQAMVEQPRMRGNLSNVVTYSVLAHILNRRGDLDGAAAATERANVLLPRLTDVFWWMMIETRILLAPALAALGRTDEAETRLAEAGELLTAHPDAGQLPEWHQETVRKLRVATRSTQASDELSDAERRVLRLLAGDLSLPDIARELYLSLNTVKTHRRSIYRKLGVSSRAEAVAAARIRADTHLGSSPRMNVRG